MIFDSFLCESVMCENAKRNFIYKKGILQSVGMG